MKQNLESTNSAGDELPPPMETNPSKNQDRSRYSGLIWQWTRIKKLIETSPPRDNSSHYASKIIELENKLELEMKNLSDEFTKDGDGAVLNIPDPYEERLSPEFSKNYRPVTIEELTNIYDLENTENIEFIGPSLMSINAPKSIVSKVPDLPEGYAYTGGTARNVFAATLGLSDFAPSRDYDVARLIEEEPEPGLDEKLSEELMPEDYETGFGVKKIDVDYFNTRDFTNNEILLVKIENGFEIVFSNLCFADTVRGVVRMTENPAQGDWRSDEEIERRKTHFKIKGMRLLYENMRNQKRDQKLKLNPEYVSENVDIFYAALNLDRAYEVGKESGDLLAKELIEMFGIKYSEGDNVKSVYDLMMHLKDRMTGSFEMRHVSKYYSYRELSSWFEDVTREQEQDEVPTNKESAEQINTYYRTLTTDKRDPVKDNQHLDTYVEYAKEFCKEIGSRTKYAFKKAATDYHKKHPEELTKNILVYLDDRDLFKPVFDIYQGEVATKFLNENNLVTPQMEDPKELTIVVHKLPAPIRKFYWKNNLVMSQNWSREEYEKAVENDPVTVRDLRDKDYSHIDPAWIEWGELYNVYNQKFNDNIYGFKYDHPSFVERLNHKFQHKEDAYYSVFHIS